jgi:hypothetical protein
MIDVPTVVVVGAGGSVPYGFLTGDKLKWAICDGLGIIDDFPGKGIVGSQLAVALNSAGFKIEEMVKLRDSLRQSAWLSIDEFLAEHHDLQAVGKAAIAGILIPLEKRGQLFDPRDEHGNRMGSWYQLLFRTIFSPFHEIQKNKVTILTYNYDVSLETYLEGAMQNSYSCGPSEISAALKYVPIVHLHGKFADHEYGGGIAGDSLRRCAEQLHIMAEQIDENSEFQRATAALWEAQQVFFVGFGYDENNLKRLPIESRYPPGSPGARMGAQRPSLNLFGTSYQLAPARRARVTKYFRDKGFGIQLGGDHDDAYRFLQNSHQFGRQ